MSDSTRREQKRRAFQSTQRLRDRMLYGIDRHGIPLYMHYDGTDDFTKHASQLERIRSAQRAREVADAVDAALVAVEHVIALLDKYRE